MAFEHITQRIPGLSAGADLSSSQFLAVKPGTTAGTVVAASAATDDCIGIVCNAPEEGEAAEVACGGILKGKAGGSIDAGAMLTVNSSGELVAASTGGDTVVGYAVQAAADGDIFPFVWQRSRY